MTPHAQSFTTQQVNTRSVRDFFAAKVGWLNVVTLGVLFVLCLSYIFYVNSVISQGYKMRELETRINNLTLSNQEIELDSRKAQSLKNVERSVKMLGLVKADGPVYVKSTEPSYALAD